jgi:membrane protein
MHIILVAKNICMQKLIALYKYFTDKRFSTISGTLVYFLLMSIAPFLLWLTLFIGNFDLERILSHRIFEAIQPIVGYLKSSAESAASSAGLILLVTSLYSSTNFFYHLRRSGEIIYGEKKLKGGIVLRLSALTIIFGIILSLSLMAATPFFSRYFLYSIMPAYVADGITTIFLCMSALFVSLLLNYFACPYKLDFDGAIAGSLLTTILWIILAVAFTIYLKFANPVRLYGKIASLIVFLLWCYVMINCLVIGIIYNQMFLGEKKRKVHF